MRKASSPSASLPPVKGRGLVQADTPTGATAMAVMARADTLPAAPGSKAWAGTSTSVSPGAMIPSSVVSMRTISAVRHTVPWGMVRAVSELWAVKRMEPSAWVACLRVSPRS